MGGRTYLWRVVCYTEMSSIPVSNLTCDMAVWLVTNGFTSHPNGAASCLKGVTTGTRTHTLLWPETPELEPVLTARSWHACVSSFGYCFINTFKTLSVGWDQPWSQEKQHSCSSGWFPMPRPMMVVENFPWTFSVWNVIIIIWWKINKFIFFLPRCQAKQLFFSWPKWPIDLKLL